METLLNILVRTQNQHGAVCRQTRFWGYDRHGELSILLNRHDAHMLPLTYVQLSDRFPDPALGDADFKHSVVIT